MQRREARVWHEEYQLDYQEFEDIIINDLFYVDKNIQFIKEWWERRNRVTLITRPRRFGKTLTMN